MASPETLTPIRLAVPEITAEDLAAVERVLKTGFLAQGKEVLAFEQAFARYVGTEHAVAVSNCTAALHMVLVALDIRAGDIVITTTYSWPATANAIELVGATPHFVDIDEQTFAMSASNLEAAISSLRASGKLKSVKAILPVHAFGQLAAIEDICAIAARENIPVIEDAACALGAKRNGKAAGDFGKMACFSFHPRKALTTGEGGMITTNDGELAHKLRSLRNHGLDPTSPTPDFILPGFNYRMTEFQAALGVSQLARFDAMLAMRQQKSARYVELLQNSNVRVPGPLDGAHSFQSFVVLLPAHVDRSAVIQELKASGIESTIGTYMMPTIRFFREKYGYAAGDFPTTKDVAERSLSLPLHAFLTDEDQQRIATALRSLCA